jgi:hypothetical protein
MLWDVEAIHESDREKTGAIEYYRGAESARSSRIERQQP